MTTKTEETSGTKNSTPLEPKSKPKPKAKAKVSSKIENMSSTEESLLKAEDEVMRQSMKKACIAAMYKVLGDWGIDKDSPDAADIITNFFKDHLVVIKESVPSEESSSNVWVNILAFVVGGLVTAGVAHVAGRNAKSEPEVSAALLE